MAQTLKLKRSATPSAVPTTGQLDLGEVAINTYDGKMYIKKDDGTPAVIEIGSGAAGPAGEGVPAGGTEAQILAKIDSTDYNTQWVNVGELDTYKLPVRGATTENITLSGNVVLDGLTTAPGDRILVKDQTNGAENGIYVAASGAWSRASDFNTNVKVKNGVMIPVQFGTTNVGSIWMLTLGSSSITLGSTILGFTKMVKASDTIGVAQGGTGATSLTANNVLLGNGTSAVQTVAPGLTGNVLTSDGTTWTSSAPAGGGSVFYKDAVRAATTANITLSGNVVMDGITTAPGDRILVKNQSTASQNGIYVAAAGAWTRATDFDTSGTEVQNGVMIPVQFGTRNGGSTWQLVQNGGTIGNSFKFLPLNGIAGNAISGWTAPTASGANAIAIGNNAVSGNTSTVAIGTSATANADSGIAIGNGASIGANPQSIAIGYLATSGNSRGICISSSSQQVTGDGNITIIAGNTAGARTNTGFGSIVMLGNMGANSQIASGSDTVSLNFSQGVSLSASTSILIGTSYMGGNVYTTSTSNSILLIPFVGGAKPIENTLINNIVIGNACAISSQGGAAIRGMSAINGISDGQKGYVFVNLMRTTTDATSTEMSTAAVSAPSAVTHRVALLDNSLFGFTATITARQTGGASGSVGTSAVFKLEGAIKRGANAASTMLVGSVTTTTIAADTDASTWTVVASADTTNGALIFTVTGQASKNITWQGRVECIRNIG